MKYKDMKIEISESQPLDEVVMQLERLGFIRSKNGRWVDRDKFILASKCGFYSRVDSTSCNFYIEITLTELKAMTNDQTRPNRSNNPAAFRNRNYLCGSVG